MKRSYFTLLLVFIGSVAVFVAVSLPIEAASLSGSCLLYTSPSPRDGLLSRMPSSA